jgi:sortase family protein
MDRSSGAAVQGEPTAASPAGLRSAFHGAVPGWVAAAQVSVSRPIVPSSPTPANSVPNVAVAAVAANPAPVAPKPTKATGSAGSTTKVAPSYKGRNHLWIPALGVNRSVSFYSCSRSTALANVVYRWGCGGSNNVYLMGHAWGVFKPLHDAYYNGRLRKGMQVIYADASGRVTRYRVSFWKVVSPVGAGWAYAAQSRPSMTLQTCVGANSKYRLVVRLVASN